MPQLPLFENVDLNGEEWERLVLVGGDLEYLIELPRDRLLTHTEVRISAGILRRLVDDKQLQKVWNKLFPNPEHALMVDAFDLAPSLPPAPGVLVRFAFAGGIKIPGTDYGSAATWVIPDALWNREYGSVSAYQAANPFRLPEWQSMSLKKWASGVSVAAGSPGGSPPEALLRISRLDVIKFMANRKGGVHIDPEHRRDGPPRKKKAVHPKYRALDQRMLRVGHLSGPEFEINAMVHAIAQAPWATAISALAKELAPADFDGDPSEMKVFTGGSEADADGWSTFRPNPDSRLPEPESPLWQRPHGEAGSG